MIRIPGVYSDGILSPPPRLPLNATIMLLLCATASCVLLKENTGGWIYLVVLLINSFTVITSHELVEICCLYSLPLIVFPISWHLSKVFFLLYIR